MFVMGDGFQPAVEAAADQRDGPTVELLAKIGEANVDDPHVWLDPVLYSKIVDQVRAELVQADPDCKATIDANAARYQRTIDAVGTDYAAGAARLQATRRSSPRTRRSVTSRRATTSTQQGIAGIAPDAGAERRSASRTWPTWCSARASPRSSPRSWCRRGWPNALAREAGGVKTETLNPLEGLTEREQRTGRRLGVGDARQPDEAARRARLHRRRADRSDDASVTRLPLALPSASLSPSRVAGARPGTGEVGVASTVIEPGDKAPVIEVRPVKRALGLGSLVFIMFFTVSGGAYGLEDVIGSSGPGIGILLIVLTPLVVQPAERADGRRARDRDAGRGRLLLLGQARDGAVLGIPGGLVVLAHELRRHGDLPGAVRRVRRRTSSPRSAKATRSTAGCSASG